MEAIKNIDKHQPILHLLSVDYSKFFDFKNLTKNQINAILGIEAYLGNKAVVFYVIAQRNERFRKLIEYKTELKEIIGDKMHFDVAEKGIQALDELTKRIEFLEREMAKLYKEIEEDKTILQYLSKEELKRWLDNL